MRVIRSSRQMAQAAQRARRQGRMIGFVPTMGALHEGHLSLIRAARAQTDVVVVSLFVNPLQFGPTEDYRRYPRTLQRDLRLIRAAGGDAVFAPDVAQIYPAGFQTYVQVEDLSDRFEGAIRPGHFRGVTTVVMKLLQLVQPAIAYFGQKDYQQARIIQRMVADLAVPVTVRVMPTIRETDGLAMSSRNVYLAPPQRRQATALWRALRLGKTRIHHGERRVPHVVKDMRGLLRQERGVRVDYLAIADASTLEPLKVARGRVVILGAIRHGSTRLIANILVDVS